jgi:hypothetical protein
MLKYVQAEIDFSEENTMPLTANTIEQMGEWCLQFETIAGVRSKARGEFFGYDEPGTIKYMEGAEELNARERRFLGWFCFTFRLPDGKYPAELAADSIFSGAELKSALKSIQGVRFVMAVVTMVAPGKGAYLQLENEEFEVDSRYLSQNIEKDDVLRAHILPVGRNRWVLGPGWMARTTCFFSNRSLRCLQLGEQFEAVTHHIFKARLESGPSTPFLMKFPFPEGGLYYGIF